MHPLSGGLSSLSRLHAEPNRATMRQVSRSPFLHPPAVHRLSNRRLDLAPRPLSVTPIRPGLDPAAGNAEAILIGFA